MNKRRKFNSGFKTKVVLDALSERYSIQELSRKHGVHANQISYLRSLKDPIWDFGEHFGDMATALIALNYHTTKDLNIKGF